MVPPAMKLVLISLAVLLLTVDGGRSASPPTVASVAALRAGDFTGAHTLILSGFNAGSTMGFGTLTATQDGADDSCLVYADKAGHRFRRTLNGKTLDAAMCGVRCGGQHVSDGRSTAGSPVITSSAARWTSAMVGWRVVVNKAGPSGQQIDTAVAAVGANGSLILSTPAGASRSGEAVSVYPDDTAGLDAAFAAAGKPGLFVQLPAGNVCGYANPGARIFKQVSGPGLLLNGGALWLGHTGPAMDTGVGLQFSANGSVVRGPGTINGLYQTDQNSGQYNTTAVLFSHTTGSAISGHVTIQNTKGRAFLGDTVKNFSLTDVTVRDCGDFSFHPPANMDIMVGRSMCGQVTAPGGNLTVRNYTGINAAQAGLLVYGPTDAIFRASISGCHFSGNGYYGLDLEEISGSVTVSDCEQTGNGQEPSPQLIYGGYIIRGLAHFSATNVRSSLTDSNAFVMLSAGGKLQDWSIDGLTLTGTPARHAATLYVSFADSGYPEHVSLKNVTYDNWTMYVNGAPCTLSSPRRQLLSFQNVRASGLHTSTQTELDFQANPGQKTYVEGRNSDLGIATIKALTGNKSAIFLDLAAVHMIGSAPESGPFHCP